MRSKMIGWQTPAPFYKSPFGTNHNRFYRYLVFTRTTVRHSHLKYVWWTCSAFFAINKSHESNYFQSLFSFIASNLWIIIDTILACPLCLHGGDSTIHKICSFFRITHCMLPFRLFLSVCSCVPWHNFWLPQKRHTWRGDFLLNE